MAIDVFETAVEYMDRINSELPSMVESYKTNNLDEVSDKMVDLFDGLNWIYDVVRLTAEFHSLESSDILELYVDLTQALENKEYALLADLLHYELMPLIKTWREILSTSLKNLTSN